MSEAEGSADGSWRKDGRCSACRFFAIDFGDAPDFYGHCKMHTRPGAREARDYACPEYRPLAGFEDLTGSTSLDRLPDISTAEAARRARARAALGASAPRPRSQGAKLILRRRDAEGGVQAAQRRADLPVDEDVVAALTGQGGDSLDPQQLRAVLIDVVENFLGIEDVELGAKWQGGTVTIQPEDETLKPHVIPVEALFHKIVMVRDRLRVLEAKLNAHEGLSDADKVELQQYISRCYGSLTTFNVLFKDKDDKFSSK